MTYLDVWNADCVVCEQRIGIVEPWEPSGDGIRHVTCEPSEVE